MRLCYLYPLICQYSALALSSQTATFRQVTPFRQKSESKIMHCFLVYSCLALLYSLISELILDRPTPRLELSEATFHLHMAAAKAVSLGVRRYFFYVFVKLRRLLFVLQASAHILRIRRLIGQKNLYVHPHHCNLVLHLQLDRHPLPRATFLPIVHHLHPA